MTFRQAIKSYTTKSSRLFLIVLAVAALLALFATTGGFRREETLRQEIARSYETRNLTQTLFSLILDAETSQRGYLITQDRRFLRPYIDATERIASIGAAARSVVGVDRRLAADVAGLESLIDQKLKTLASGIAVNDRDGATAARAAVIRGQPELDRAVRRQAEKLSADERTELQAYRTAALQFRLLRNGLIVVSILMIASIIGWVIRRDEKQHAARAALIGEIKEVAERQKVIFDGAMDMILTINPSGGIESVNAAGLRMLGYTEADLLRRDIGVLVDMTPERFSIFLQGLSSPENLETGLVRTMAARHKSGREIPVDVALRAMRLTDGHHMVAVIRDISDRRKIEVLKDNFVANVSHELRTPLTSIAGSLGLLKGGAGGQLPTTARRLVEIAEINSRRLVRLINDILDMEKIQSGAAVFDRRPLQLLSLAQMARDGMSGLAQELGVTLTLGEVDPALWVLADEDRMMQVMSNLLSNAIKVSPVEGKVTIEVKTHDGAGRLCIIDQGPGVPEEFKTRIFERFAQADGADSRVLDGTGLGLTIVREIIERHDGLVNFHNNAGAGATFFADLPLIAPPEVHHAQASEPDVRILICEDDELIAGVVSDQIEMFGWAPEVVDSANAARHALYTGEYAALLLDIRLPDSDGVTLIKALRSAPATASLPIVVMSGSPEHQEEARALGIVDWLHKPIPMDRLREALELALRPRRTIPALILHVDDDPDLVEIARSRLGGLGSVLNARTLSAAREALAERAPDLVILDVGLPDGSGEALIEDLRTIYPGIPALVYSAQDLLIPLAWPIEAVLTKSKADLTTLAKAAKRILEDAGRAPA